jgi:hypothetical protein
MPPNDKLDIGQSNQANKDNNIFTSNAEFTYSYIIKQKKGRYLCALNLNPTLENINNSNIWILVKKSKTGKVDRMIPIKKIQLYVYENHQSQESNKGETIINYRYLTGNNQTVNIEETSVVEDSARIFLHPPRTFYFGICEFAPFPDLSFPLEVGKKWKRYMICTPSLYDHYPGDIPKEISFNSTYEVKNNEKISSLFGEVDCYVIHGKSIIDSKYKTWSKFYWSDKLGFVKIVLKGFDNSTLELNLVSKK